MLAYASTGHTVPEQGELPPGLRTLVGSCLSSDPAARPRSAQEVLGALVSLGAGPATAEDPYAQAGTVLDHGAVPLPGRVVAALADQSAAVLAAEVPSPQQPFTTAQKVH